LNTLWQIYSWKIFQNEQDVICEADEGFDLIPANQALTLAEVKLLDIKDRELILKRIIENYQ
jgi:cellulose biosynthesis protein BcsQ